MVVSAKGSPGRKAKERRYQQRKRATTRRSYVDRMRQVHGPDWQPKVCEFCQDGRPVRFVQLAIPPSPGRGWSVRNLPIDVHPHPKGNVVRDPDGNHRLVADLTELPAGTPLFRVHSAATCVGLDHRAGKATG